MLYKKLCSSVIIAPVLILAGCSNIHKSPDNQRGIVIFLVPDADKGNTSLSIPTAHAAWGLSGKTVLFKGIVHQKDKEHLTDRDILTQKRTFDHTTLTDPLMETEAAVFYRDAEIQSVASYTFLEQGAYTKVTPPDVSPSKDSRQYLLHFHDTPGVYPLTKRAHTGYYRIYAAVLDTSDAK